MGLSLTVVSLRKIYIFASHNAVSVPIGHARSGCGNILLSMAIICLELQASLERAWQSQFGSVVLHFQTGLVSVTLSAFFIAA
jgi:hypothetical protein